jgi:hypothetical protein
VVDVFASAGVGGVGEDVAGVGQVEVFAHPGGVGVAVDGVVAGGEVDDLRELDPAVSEQGAGLSKGEGADAFDVGGALAGVEGVAVDVDVEGGRGQESGQAGAAEPVQEGQRRAQVLGAAEVGRQGGVLRLGLGLWFGVRLGVAGGIALRPVTCRAVTLRPITR